jgi:amino acid transporter
LSTTESVPAAERDVFVRQSSGLVREFSILDVVIINLAGLNPGLIVVLSITSLASLWAGASLPLVLLIGAIVALAIVVTYGLMSAAMPRAGGDYVFIGRSLTPWLGFTANWMMTWSLFVLLGLFSVGTVTQALAPSLAAIGALGGNTGMIDFATDMTTDKALLGAFALAIIVLCSAIALAGDRVVRATFRGLAVVALAGLAVSLVALLLTSRAGFEANIDEMLAVTGGGTLDDIRAAAGNAGFEGVDFSWSATFAALPFAFYAYVGLTYSTYLGGEIQRPQRSQPLGMMIALLVGLASYVVLGLGLYKTMGFQDIHTWAYLAGNAPDELTFFGNAALGSFLFGGIAGSPFLAVIFAVTWVVWFFMILLFAVVLPIRNLFAWSMDRVLPAAVSAVTPRGTPWVATLIVAVLAVGVVVVAVYSTFLSLVVNYTLMYSITFLIAGIAAAAFPYRRRDLFERAPAFVQRHVGKVPLVSIVGVLQTIIFVVIIREALSTSAFAGPNGRNALLFIGGLLVAAPIVFFVSKTIRERQGYDMDAAWRTLPPD